MAVGLKSFLLLNSKVINVKIMKKILPLLVFTLLGFSLAGQSNWVRTVVWVYGLGGDPTISWNKADEFSQNMKNVYGLKPYYGDLGLESAGEDLNTFLANNQGDFYGTKQPYIIAHSMGGLVSRASEKLYYDDPNLDNPYGGIVTFGTPHKGTEILDNIEELKGLLNEICILFGPVVVLEEFTNLKLLLDVFPRKQQSIATGACPNAVDLATFILSEDYLAPITQDFTPSNEGGYLNSELNNFNGDPNVESIAFWGIENDNELYRFIKWFVNSPEAEDFGEATEDQDFVDKYQEYLNEYEAKFQLWENYSYVGCGNDIICILFHAPLLAKLNGQRARFLRGLNNAWLRAVGGRDWVVTEEKQRCLCIDNPNGYGWPNEYEVSDPSECPPGCKYIDGIKLYRVDKVDETDGLITGTSAKGIPWSDDQVELPGSSHFQMRNDENTELHLNNLYRGDHGTFFGL
jgi:hypothetical protein